MSNQQSKQQKSNSLNSSEGSGSAYHRQHASHIPDYGGNSVDPNANLSNKTNSTSE